MNGRRIFITGGAGFLGRAILRRAEREGWGSEITIYSRDEEKQHQIRDRWPSVHCILGDIRNLDRLMVAMHGHDLVIHTAAVKFVPEAEYNVGETVEVNVQGAINVAAAAYAAGVRAVVGISTDKACLPINLYGATKMLMERYYAEANNWGGGARTRFVLARYGNVVGSTGSIVPVFRRQLERNGRVTVTDPAMTRFWLSPDDAVDLVVRAAEAALAGAGGTTFVPRCGAMSIGDLARLIVEGWISAADPGAVATPRRSAEDYIDIIGPRPAEKKHEALVHQFELSRTTEFGWGFGIEPPVHSTVTTHPADEFTSDRAPAVTAEWMRDAMRDAATI